MMRGSRSLTLALLLSLLAGCSGLTPTQQRTLTGGTLGAAAGAGVSALSGGHPTTGAVYLYSDRCVAEENAWASMDWFEVGLANNP